MPLNPLPFIKNSTLGDYSLYTKDYLNNKLKKSSPVMPSAFPKPKAIESPMITTRLTPGYFGGVCWHACLMSAIIVTNKNKFCFIFISFILN